MTDNPYYRKFRERKHHSKNRDMIIQRLENLKQSLETEKEVHTFWQLHEGKALEDLSNGDRFILICENLITEKSVKHLLMLQKATIQNKEHEITFWLSELEKIK